MMGCLANGIDLSPARQANRGLLSRRPEGRAGRSGPADPAAVADHAHLRELLLAQIFQINGVQRTETFLSLANVEPDNFTAAMMDRMSKRRGEAKKP
jgi:hypothetical protein